MEGEDNKDTGLPKIRTFKTDASSYIQKNQVSDLEIASKTYISQEGGREKPPQTGYKKTFFIAGGIAVLALAGYFGYALISGRFEPATPVIQGPKTPPKFVQTESETDISYIRTDQGSLANSIKNELGKQLQYGTVNTLRIKSASDYITSKTFISALGWAAPKEFIDALEPGFNVLIIYQASGNAPVFIFKTGDFIKSFAALLAWEPTMWQDMKPFLDLQSVDVKTFYQRAFVDDSLKNNDARAFTATDGRLLFEYAFFSKKFIIISTSRDALDLVLGRLLALPPQ